MSLDAGTVKSRLDLDTTSFKDGFSEAHTHAEGEGGHIREILESIAEVATEVCGPAFGELGRDIQSALAGFSEGPIVGSLNAIGVAAGMAREAVMGTNEDLHKIGVEAERAGVDVEFFGRLVAGGKLAEATIDDISQGFRLLEQRAGEAAEGNEAASKVFQKIGISVEEATKLASDPQNLWTEVTEKIGKFESHSVRAAIAHELLGKGSRNLANLLSQTSEEFNRNADTVEGYEGKITKSSVAAADSAHKMGVELESAFDGIKRAATEPIRLWIMEHEREIEDTIANLETKVIQGLGDAWDYLRAHQNELAKDGQLILLFFKDLLPLLEAAAASTEGFSRNVAQLTGNLLDLQKNFSLPKLGDTAQKLIHAVVPSPQDAPTGTTDADLQRDIDRYHATHPAASLAPALEELNSTINGLLSAWDGSRSRSADSSQPVGPSESHRAATQPTTAPSQTINVSVNFDPHESASQFAAKIVPKLRQMKQQHSEAMAGAAFVSLAKASMGSDA